MDYFWTLKIIAADESKPLFFLCFSIQGFTLEFYFAPNEYFSDSVLKKEYFVRFDPSPSDPLGFEGPEIVESKG